MSAPRRLIHAAASYGRSLSRCRGIPLRIDERLRNAGGHALQLQRAGSGRTRVEMRSRTMAASVLLTDLYELTMLQAYFAQRMNGTAVFEFFVRKLPRERNFLMAAGLEQVLDYLETLRIFGR